MNSAVSIPSLQVAFGVAAEGGGPHAASNIRHRQGTGDVKSNDGGITCTCKMVQFSASSLHCEIGSQRCWATVSTGRKRCNDKRVPDLDTVCTQCISYPSLFIRTVRRAHGAEAKRPADITIFRTPEQIYQAGLVDETENGNTLDTIGREIYSGPNIKSGQEFPDRV